MKAVIPVAGFGTRLRPHTLIHPKVLLPIAGKPMLAHIVDKLIEDGIEEIVFVVGYLGERIEEYIRQNYNFPAHFVTQQQTLGLGHAIYVSKEKIVDDEPLVIVLGDTIYDANLRMVIEGKYSSLGAREVEDPRRFGVAVLDENGFIQNLVEKPQTPVSKLALVGIYFIKNSRILFECLKEIIQKNIRTRNEYQLTDGLQLMIDYGEKMTVFNVEGWYDCGKLETVLNTNRILLEKLNSQVNYQFDSTVIIPPVYIHPEARISRSVIGPNVCVDKRTTLENAVLKNTIVGEYSEIRNALIRDSLIGNYVKLRGKTHQVVIGDYSEHEF